MDFVGAVKESKLRIVEENVPGKQITVAHVIANPDELLQEIINFKGKNISALGIVTVSPAEATIIAADIARKTSGVMLESVDRVSGTLLVSGTVSQVEEALIALLSYAGGKLGFSVCEITKT